MSDETDEYKAFIDDLVELRKSIASEWVKGEGYPDIFENTDINSFLESLNSHQKEILSSMMQMEKETGMHEVLAYLYEKMSAGEIDLYKNAVRIPENPFYVELYRDWAERCKGEKWPPE
jgi:hypothetical protein